MHEDFQLNEPHLLGDLLEKLRLSVAYKGHPLSKRMLTRSINMSGKTYAKVISGVAVMQVTTCEC